CQGEAVFAVLGRAHAVEQPAPIDESMNLGPTPLPEKLLGLREQTARRHDFHLLDSEAPAVRRLASQVRLASEVTAPVLLVGPPGCGKRTLARLIHYASASRERSLAVVDTVRLPAVALAAVLFGDRFVGRADHVGTIYLREPAALPREIQ